MGSASALVRLSAIVWFSSSVWTLPIGTTDGRPRQRPLSQSPHVRGLYLLGLPLLRVELCRAHLRSRESARLSQFPPKSKARSVEMQLPSIKSARPLGDIERH